MSKTQQSEGQFQQNEHRGPKYHSKGKFETIEEIKQEEKQALQRAYTLWVMMKSNKQIIDSYENVEDFWANYQHVKRPAALNFGTFINIFVEGVKPMWEDENCKDGGRWSLRVPKSHTNKYWEDIVLALIGEQFRCENEIIGVAVSIKPNADTIFVWNKSGKDSEKIQFIKEDIENLVKIDESMKLEYENFAEILSRPKPEKNTTFNRNQHNGEDKEGDDGFERRQISRGGGFISRGRGRGRGQQ